MHSQHVIIKKNKLHINQNNPCRIGHNHFRLCRGVGGGISDLFKIADAAVKSAHGTNKSPFVSERIIYAVN